VPKVVIPIHVCHRARKTLSNGASG
jgi:hypothetical protein